MGFLDDYEPVEERLRQFWTEHPNGRITTEMLIQIDGDYVFRADVWRDTLGPDAPSATGHAHDSTAQLPANMKASALEVCETSAIGRALANLGYAPKGKRPSREEMSKSSGGGAPTTPPPGSKSGAGTGGSMPAPDPTSAPRQEDADDREVGTPHGEEAVPASPSHAHEWIPAPNERMARLGWESCSVAKCQETRNTRKGK